MRDKITTVVLFYVDTRFLARTPGTIILGGAFWTVVVERAGWTSVDPVAGAIVGLLDTTGRFAIAASFRHLGCCAFHASAVFLAWAKMWGDTGNTGLLAVITILALTPITHF